MRLARSGLMWMVWVALAGCVRAGPNLARVDAVKKVAIIGLGGTVDLSDANASGRLSSANATLQAFGDIDSPEVQARRLREAELAYDALSASLSQGAGWTVLSRNQVKDNPVMQALFRERMAGRRVNAGYRFGIPNILWAEVAELPPARQKDLIAALGVDALVVVGVQVVSGRTYGYGAAGEGHFEVYPKATLRFGVFDGGDDAVWREPYVEGMPTQGKLLRTMGVVDDPSPEPALVEEATKLAGDALFVKLGAARNQAAATEK